MAKKNVSLSDEQRKLDPKLRMVANCTTKVNAVRAELSAAVTVTGAAARKHAVVRRDDASNIVSSKQQLVPKLKSIPGDVFVNVFIQMKTRGQSTTDVLPRVKKLAKVRFHRGNQATATVRLRDLPKLAKEQGVTSVEMGDTLAAPVPLPSDAANGAPAARVPTDNGLEALHHKGEGVLIGIIDVQGFDFAHEDFRHNKVETRFAAIWDQGGASRPAPSESGTGPFDYGAEILQKDMNKAIKAASKVGAPATDLEPQSQMVPGSHGTHVASIAAGNLGVCPGARLAGVLVALTKEDVDRRKSFYDSTRLVDAVEYLIALSKKLGGKNKPLPLSINISLGTNGHAHDGSAACCRWIDAALSVPGRCVSVAAGNAGQEVAEFPGDLGYFLGRIHTRGSLPASDLTTDIEMEVIGNGRVDISENELEIWYSPQDRFEVSLRPPGGEWLGPYKPREFLQNHRLQREGHFVSIYNELYHPSNGANYIAIYLTPFLDPKFVVGIKAGTWTVRLHGLEIRSGEFHGWIERDDPRPAGRIGNVDAWRFPSCFSEKSNVDNSSISTLATARHVVAVGNLDSTRERIHISSSQGPTRDDRLKPDVAAPGTDVVAAKGFAGEGEWIAMTGTSMASPYVTGVAGLMLAAQRELSASQIVGIMQRTARPLPGRGFPWTNDGGFGCINAAECVREAALANKRVERHS
jgi:subtilisin family serine protease